MDASPDVTTTRAAIAPALFEKIVVGDDLSALNAVQRADYYASAGNEDGS